MHWQLPRLVGPENYSIILEYPIDPTPRYGYGKPAHSILEKIISSNSDLYADLLGSFVAHGKALTEIASVPSPNGYEPSFDNSWFSGLDAIALYSILANTNPATLFEIGSGMSTRFARRAIKDNGLRTKIVSCDPQPRAEIDAISDEIIRQPFETIDLSVLGSLGENDILFIDSSHRSFTNSDVTVQFLEAIPSLKPGVLVHVHDIMLPYDYPPSWSNRHYSEQYLLACYFLGGGGNYEIIMPNAYVSLNERLSARLEPLWQLPGMSTVFSHTKKLYHGYLGFSFWMKIKHSIAA